MKIRFLIYVVVALSLLTASCTENIDLTLSSTSTRVVVDGHLCDQKSDMNYVRLTLSANYYSSHATPAISGAKVVVNDGESDIEFAESDTKPGYYYAPEMFTAIYGRTYTLNISNVDYNSDGELETYTAQSIMPNTYTVDSITCKYNKTMEHYMVGMYGPEDVTVENYYAFCIAHNDTLVSDSYSELSVTDDKWFTNDYVHGATIYYFSEDDIDRKIKEGDKVTLFGMAITKELFDYINAVSDISGGGNPVFSSTPANAVGNISGGALGFFTTYAVKRVDCEIRSDSGDLK